MNPRSFITSLLLFPVLWTVWGCSCSKITAPDTVPVYTYEIVNTYPHDPDAFTQGLVYQDGFLYESTGRYGQSSLRQVELETGKVLQLHLLSPRYFGEGIALHNGKIYQLTWESRVGFIYDQESFTREEEFHYSTPGWGLTFDGEHLIMSDGTPTLYLLDPETCAEVGRLEITAEGNPLSELNELEYIQGEIYANVWQQSRIARISPASGRVTAWIELEGILSPEAAGADVLNGIAYDDENDRLFVTGKLWPSLFEIKLIPP